ncbi:hypothetical protein P171DRAFT_434593 [Karstenula rhodostoma CBS 690.94]|uniref:Uncharacterized protein n=1 Tax=Karstenula rhodostoma CBS 690.94 TaxID=1392251 RepID=A0A9P4PBG4_9PLEO|nr:hypothetical protein P171DRAFT_434593 [Karstenula rhodostoma CBS 690.94]
MDASCFSNHVRDGAFRNCITALCVVDQPAEKAGSHATILGLSLAPPLHLSVYDAIVSPFTRHLSLVRFTHIIGKGFLSVMIFHPNCTLPDSPPVFVSAPNVRSTTEILWNCISTVFLCTWSILFLNIPPQTRPRTKTQWMRKRFSLFTMKVKWMIITLLAPEFIMGLALSNFWSARCNHKTLKCLADEDGVDWSRAHTFYADMGGFVIEFKEASSYDTAETSNESPHEEGGQSAQPPPPLTFHSNIEERNSEAIPLVDMPSPGPEAGQHVTSYRNSGREQNAITAEQRYFGIVGEGYSPFWGGESKMDKLDKLGLPAWKMDREYRGMVAELLNPPHTLADLATKLHLQGSIWVLNAQQLVKARRKRVISRLPQLSEAELGDKNKGDYLVKTLALLQIAWMLAQLVTRWKNKRPVSQLEVMTLSFAACAVVIYALILPRPQGVETPTVVLGRRATLDKMRSIANADSSPLTMRRFYTIPNDMIHHDRAFSVGAGLGAILFGILHVVAWDFTFPTAVERKLWRVSSVTTVATPICSLALLITFETEWIEISSVISIFLMNIAFIVARLFLLVEAFRSLYYQPVDVFVATWGR